MRHDFRRRPARPNPRPRPRSLRARATLRRSRSSGKTPAKRQAAPKAARQVRRNAQAGDQDARQAESRDEAGGQDRWRAATTTPRRKAAPKATAADKSAAAKPRRRRRPPRRSPREAEARRQAEGSPAPKAKQRQAEAAAERPAAVARLATGSQPRQHPRRRRTGASKPSRAAQGVLRRSRGFLLRQKHGAGGRAPARARHLLPSRRNVTVTATSIGTVSPRDGSNMFLAPRDAIAMPNENNVPRSPRSLTLTTVAVA